MQAIQRGLADEREMPSAAADRKPKAERSADDVGVRDQERILVALKEWRSKVTRERNLPQICVMANGQFQAIARRAPTDIETLGSLADMRRWQVAEWGEDILKVVASIDVRRGPPVAAVEGEEPTGGRRRRRR